MDATREPRERPFTAKLMEVADGANSLGARKVLKAGQITAFLMVVAVVVLMKVAPKLLEESLVCASGMEVARGVRKRIALRARKATPAFVSLTEVVGVVNFQSAPKGLKEARNSARRMEGARGVHFRVVIRGLKEALNFAKGMVEEGDAHSRVVVSARKVFMVELNFVLHMVAGKGVQPLNAPRVREDGQSFV